MCSDMNASQVQYPLISLHAFVAHSVESERKEAVQQTMTQRSSSSKGDGAVGFVVLVTVAMTCGPTQQDIEHSPSRDRVCVRLK